MRTVNIHPRRGVYDCDHKRNGMVVTRNRKNIDFEVFHENNHSHSSDEENSRINSGDLKKYSDTLECVNPDHHKGTLENSPQHEKKSNGLGRYTIWILLLCATLIIYTNFLSAKEEGPTSYKEKTILLENVKILSKKFPSQDDNVWAYFLSGIKTIVTDDPTKPSVFLLLHFGDNEHTSDCLARHLAYKAKMFLSNDSGNPIFLKGKDLRNNFAFIDDYGSFIHKYKPDIEKKHVMVIFDLQDVPPVVAQSFHSLCDVDNPVIREAAYVFTLKVDKESKLNNPTKIAEKTLNSLWGSSLARDIRDALIIRIANIVLFINPEHDIPC